MKANVVYILFQALMFVSVSCAAQNWSAAMRNADSTGFSPNLKDGWGLFNSYVSRNSDGSVSLEFIIQHAKQGIDWSKEQLVGRMKNNALLPSMDRYVNFYLIYDMYMVHITREGKCYLSLAKGNLPPGDPVILPIQVKF